MSRWFRISYALGLTALAAAYLFVLPDPPRLLWTAIGAWSIGAMVAGIRYYRPRPALPWWLVATGTATFIAGDAAYDVLTTVFGFDNPFPSPADILYLLTYPLLAVGLLLFVRARSAGSNRAALLDALILTIGLGLLSWVFLVKPYVQDGSLSSLEKAVAVSYPLGDILLLAVLARLLIGGGTRSLSVRLLSLGTVALLVADVLYGLSQLNDGWQTGGQVDLGWIVFYGAWGAAALQPDMAQLAEPVRTRSVVMSRAWLGLLAGVSLIAPVLLLVEIPAGHSIDVGVIAVASAALFLLVTARLDGLVSVARRSAQREQVLRRASETLVAASSPEQIYRASGQAVLEITGDPDEHWVLLAVDTGSGPHVVHDSAATGRRLSTGFVASLVVRHGPTLRDNQFLLTDTDHEPPEIGSLLGPGIPLLVVAIVRNNKPAGLLVAAGKQVRRAGMIDAVCALAAQMALALESVDLTEQVSQRRSEAHFRSLIQNTSDVILVVDRNLHVTYQTPSARAALGYRSEEVLGHPVTDFLLDEDAPHATLLLQRLLKSRSPSQQTTSDPATEWRLRHADGQSRVVEVTASNLFDDPSIHGLVLTLHDVTDRRELEQELKHLAFHDSLTRLPNRALFLDRVEHALSRQERHSERLAVVLIDLDDFKIVNDTLGHAAGDTLLIAVAERLRECLREGDTGARLGGDEFAVLVEGLLTDDEARQLADRLLQTLRRPYIIGEEETVVRASIGVATSRSGSDAAELLRQADLAMYAAKDAGKGSHELFHSSLQDRVNQRLQQRRDLERALEHLEFVLHYQPVVELDTGRVLGTEALLRWQHPNRGLVLPGEFIDAVEQSDLAVPLGTWVLNEAIAQAAAWQSAYPDEPTIGMSINVAPRQFRDPGFVATVTDALVRHAVPPRALTLEITERMLADEDPQTVGSMHALRDLGVSLALDDFGTGYSALAYLRRFPVTELKIDRSFIAGVDSSADDHALVQAIVQLKDIFGLDLVAEGIETDGQRDALLTLGCRQGQGFLYSRAIPQAELTALLDAQAAPDLDHLLAK